MIKNKQSNAQEGEIMELGTQDPKLLPWWLLWQFASHKEVMQTLVNGQSVYGLCTTVTVWMNNKDNRTVITM